VIRNLSRLFVAIRVKKMKPLRLAAVSIDLDDIDCYHAIHGLPATSQAPSHAVYDRALPRFEAFF
jgi:hypothetical protein